MDFSYLLLPGLGSIRIFDDTELFIDKYLYYIQMPESKSRTVQSTKKTLKVIEALGGSDGKGVKELADQLDYPQSTVHNHLASLIEEGFVVKADNQYRLSLVFLELGQQLRTRKGVYIQARELLDQLADETDSWAHFVVEERGKAVNLYTQSGPRSFEAFPDVGNRFPMHVGAAGKAILAEFGDEEIDEIIETHGLEQATPHTITDKQALFDEIEEIRSRGYAFNVEEHVEGVRAVGAPVHLESGKVIGAFSVSGPTHRMKGDRFREELPNIVLGTANELEIWCRAQNHRETVE